MKEESTETHIRQTAKRIFFGQGRLNAKMHEIAREAGINRALLHYYFRNRENLFSAVFKEAMEDSFIRMFSILSTRKPFEQKVAAAIHHIVDCLAEYPFMETFIISEINKDPENAASVSPIRPGKSFTKRFRGEVRDYLKKQKIRHITPEHFIVNMMAVCAYPASTKPIVRSILNLSEKQYLSFMSERKEMLVRVVLLK